MGYPPPRAECQDDSVTLVWSEPAPHQRATLETEEQGPDGSSDWVRLYTGTENSFKVKKVEHPAGSRKFRVRYVDADGGLDVSGTLCLEYEGKAHSNGPSALVNGKTAAAGKNGKSEMMKPRNGFHHPEPVENGNGPRKNGFHHAAGQADRAAEICHRGANGDAGAGAPRPAAAHGEEGSDGCATASREARAGGDKHDLSNGDGAGPHGDAAEGAARRKVGGKNGVVAKGGKQPASAHEQESDPGPARLNGGVHLVENASARPAEAPLETLISPGNVSTANGAAAAEDSDSSPRVCDGSAGSPSAGDREGSIAENAAEEGHGDAGSPAAASSDDSQQLDAAGDDASAAPPAGDSAPKPSWASILKSREPALPPVRVVRPGAVAAAAAARGAAAARAGVGGAPDSNARRLELDAWKRAQEEAKLQAELEARRAVGDGDRKVEYWREEELRRQRLLEEDATQMLRKREEEEAQRRRDDDLLRLKASAAAVAYATSNGNGAAAGLRQRIKIPSSVGSSETGADGGSERSTPEPNGNGHMSAGHTSSDDAAADDGWRVVAPSSGNGRKARSPPAVPPVATGKEKAQPQANGDHRRSNGTSPSPSTPEQPDAEAPTSARKQRQAEQQSGAAGKEGGKAKPASAPAPSPAAPRERAAPRAVSAQLTGDGEASVSWVPPACAARPSGYVIQTDWDRQGLWQQSERTRSCSVRVPGLLPGQHVSWRAFCMFDGCLGDPSEVASLRLAPCAPPAPAPPVALPGREGGASVRWAPPAYDNGSPVLSYRLEMSVADGPFAKIYSGAATAHKPPKASLPIGQSVRFRVRASNAVGPGPMSGPSMPFVPLPPLPPPPSPSPSADGRSRASSPAPSPGPGSLYKGALARGRGGFGAPGSPRTAPPSPLSMGGGGRWASPFANGHANGYANGHGFSGLGRHSASASELIGSRSGADLAPAGADGHHHPYANGSHAPAAAAASAPEPPRAAVVADPATCKRAAARTSWRKLMRKHKIDALFWPLVVTAILSIVLLRAVLFGGSPHPAAAAARQRGFR